ncbi:hypothetical protein ISCGN_005610 [Ixodes scapularis]
MYSRRQKFEGRGSVSRNDWLRLLTACGRSQDSRFEICFPSCSKSSVFCSLPPDVHEITGIGARCRNDSHHAARLPQPPWWVTELAHAADNIWRHLAPVPVMSWVSN